MYIIDADTLILAKRTYFQFDRVWPFWDWLAQQAENDIVTLPIETWKRMADKPEEQRDDLANWLRDHKDIFVIEDRSYDSQYPTVLEKYNYPDGSPPTNSDVEILIRDDLAVIASALHLGATVVTNEVSQTSQTGPKSKIPDVCDQVGVKHTDLDGRKGPPGLIDILDWKIPR